MVKCVILTGIPASIFPEGSSWTLHVRTMSFGEFVERLKLCDAIENYNRHEPTNKLLEKYGVRYDRGTEYKLQPGDTSVIYVIGLKRRAPAGATDVHVSEEDLLVLHVVARPGPA